MTKHCHVNAAFMTFDQGEILTDVKIYLRSEREIDDIEDY